MNKLYKTIMDGVLEKLAVDLASKPEKPKKPRWRLEPDEKGTYTLQKWNGNLEMYVTEVVRVTEDDAPRIIANLQRDHIYVGAE